MKRWSLVAAFVAVCGVAWFARGGSKSGSSGVEPKSIDTVAETSPAPPKPRPKPRAAPPRPKAPPQEKDDSDAPDSPSAAAEAPSEPTAEEVTTALDQALHAEPVDAEWGRAMESRVNDFLHTERGAGTSLTRTECRSTMCKVEARHEGADSMESFIDGVSAFIPRGSQAVVQPHRDAGRETTVVYFTRQGPPPMP